MEPLILQIEGEEKAFIEEEVQRGTYQDADDMVRSLLRKARRERIVKEMEEKFAQADASEKIAWTDEATRQMKEEVRRRLAETDSNP